MQSPASSLPAFLNTLQETTRLHQQAHGCSAHVFDDGPGLWQLLAQHQPQRILELGTGLGYTACLMACASPRAQVDTLEGDAEHTALARQHIAACGLEQRVHVREGSFLPVLQALNFPPYSLDLIFFDGHAPALALVRQLHGLLRHGGLLVCANIEISKPHGSRRVKAELEDGLRWRTAATLENGQTRVATALHEPPPVAASPSPT